MVTNFTKYLKEHTSIAPLVIFRIAFGLLMLCSVSRFILKGWVHTMYVAPRLFFPYFGFEWVKPLPETGMYLVFGLLILSSLGILLGAFYRASALVFFVLFTYVELIDKTNYLNHYYFVSLVSFILVFLPAAHAFSVDNRLFGRGETSSVPRFFILLPSLQMFIVYFFAGVAKLNPYWLLEAQPLKMWLPAFSHFKIIGPYMEEDWVAYFFSWFACVYDLLIGFLLFNKRTVKIAYVFVVIFHLATSLFFNIGMFPYIMITITIIFFPVSLHEKILGFLRSLFWYRPRALPPVAPLMGKSVLLVFIVYFLIQVFLPFRYAFYPGKLFWTEQGYRFSWRVMLMEKAGTAFFYVKDKRTGKQSEVDNKEYLTFMQEKMMATQPDMMVDYARFLKLEYIGKGYADPEVRAQAFVTLNGSGTREFIDPEVDLAAQNNSFFKNKSWVRSY